MANESFDLDLTSYLPQKAHVRAGEASYLIDSVQPPEVVWQIGLAARALEVAMRNNADTSTALGEVFRIGANVLQADEREATALGWPALMRLFAFLARPINDLAQATRLLSPPSTSPPSSTEP